MTLTIISFLHEIFSADALRSIELISWKDKIETTADVIIPENPFERVVGQDHAISLVKAATSQRRHVLLCGVPGTGKSMIGKAAYTLLPRPNDEIRLRYNPKQPDRPLIVIDHLDEVSSTQELTDEPPIVEYIHPDDLPFEVAIKMGYRCQRCGAFSSPQQSSCMDCGAFKRHDQVGNEGYHGLFRILDVVREPAKKTVFVDKKIDGKVVHTTFEDSVQGMIKITMQYISKEKVQITDNTVDGDFVLVSRTSPRFIRVSGASPVELLGDVKHDPYGSAQDLATAAHMRVVPGGIHEAHEGILYIDEIGAVGQYQKHLLTAMQDKIFPILGHNPQSSGAAVRVDNVPCDFILFASCNIEDLPKIHPALRSRIRGYGYEIMLSSWIERNENSEYELVKFIAHTVEEDGRIPHMSQEAITLVLNVAESMARRIDRQTNVMTLRLRELGGLVRIAGDFAVQENAEIVEPRHVKSAESISQGIGSRGHYTSYERDLRTSESYGDYFF